MSRHLATDTFARKPAPRGFMPLYYADHVNHCPGCSGTSWNIGRFSAECATCATAIPLAEVAAQPMRPLFHVTRSSTAMVA